MLQYTVYDSTVFGYGSPQEMREVFDIICDTCVCMCEMDSCMGSEGGGEWVQLQWQANCQNGFVSTILCYKDIKQNLVF